MNKLSLICLFILILWANCFSQFLPGAKEIAMSNSTVAECGNVFSLFYNPAGLANHIIREAGFYFSPSPFGLKELRNVFAAYTEPFEKFSISVGYKNYGFELYKENEFLIGVSSNVLNNFDAGVSFSLYSLTIKKYGQSNYFSINLGNVFRIDSLFSFAYSIRNIYLTDYKETIKKPIVFETGIAYRKYEMVITAALLKEMRHNPSYALGIDYDLIKYFSLRFGFRNYPQSFSFGVGVNYSFLQFNYAGFNNFNLGLTHQIDLILKFRKY